MRGLEGGRPVERPRATPRAAGRRSAEQKKAEAGRIQQGVLEEGVLHSSTPHGAALQALRRAWRTTVRKGGMRLTYQRIRLRHDAHDDNRRGRRGSSARRYRGRLSPVLSLDKIGLPFGLAHRRGWPRSVIQFF